MYLCNLLIDYYVSRYYIFYFGTAISICGNWVQEPSQVDYENAVKEGYRVYGTSFVFGNDNHIVYMYNSKGYKMQMSFDDFVNINK